MSALLPPVVRSTLESLVHGLSKSDMSKRSSAISAGYQLRQNSSKELLTLNDALTYALARMPATYAATRRSLLHLHHAMPELAPKSLLDIGCGPGTASFAAQGVFDGLKSFTQMDRNGPFLDLARQLSAVTFADSDVSIVEQDISKIQSLPRTDLIIASYVLSEISKALLPKFLDQLWDSSQQALLLVEPGTPDGFERLKQARIALIKSGAFIAAPCTHEAACPMAGKNWCRFFERVQRSRDHRILKSADRPFEDEPFAYLAVTRSKPSSRAAARVVARPIINKFQIQLPICAAEGLSTLHIARRDKENYKKNSDLGWGDAVLKLNQAPHTSSEY